MDDDELLRRWGEGDQDAGNELFTRYFDSVHRFFSSLFSGPVDDLVQRTFHACVRRRSDIRASFRAFLFGVARKELLMELRARAKDRVQDIDLMVSSMVDLDPSPSSLVGRDQSWGRVIEALRQLPVDQQIAVELHYWEDLSIVEVAELTETPPGTVKSRLRLARNRLQGLLGPEFELK